MADTMLPPHAAHLPDLRFGVAPLPAPQPGYAPAADAWGLVDAASWRDPGDAPIPGVVVTGSLAPGQRYVLRIPDGWNGKLVVAGTPAFRSEYANDCIWGAYAIAHGYAFASSNKGIPYAAIVEPLAASTAPDEAYHVPFAHPALPTTPTTYRLGALSPEPTSIAAWNDDYARLVRFARATVAELRGTEPARTYAVGLSNGGAQVRTLLERHPELVDGGVEWAAVYWSVARNMLRDLPVFLDVMPRYRATGVLTADDAKRLRAAGFPPDVRQDDPAHPSLYDEHYANAPTFYADLSVFAYARMLDPTARHGVRDLAERAAYVPAPSADSQIAAIAHTGAIGKPLVGIAGGYDVFITPEHHFAAYRRAVDAAGCGERYAQFLVPRGTHVDAFAAFGYEIEPQLPYAWAALDHLVAIVEHGDVSPARGTALVANRPADITSKEGRAKARRAADVGRE
jgi:hypothetical protein